MVQCAVEDPSSYALRLKHTGDKRLELDVAVVELGRNRARKLKLVGLEAWKKSAGK